MVTRNAFIAAFAATTVLTASVAFAAEQAATNPPMSKQQTTLDKDVGKLSADGSRAYNDIALTRLAIFDGRIDDAKKFIGEADSAFGTAKTDETAFTKAEADFKTPDMKGGAQPAPSGTAGSDAAATSQANAEPAPGGTAAKQAAHAQSEAMLTPKTWLPVDAEMSLNEDFSTDPAKAKAVADANKSLAKGDRSGAMQALKLASVDVDYVMAVVPLDQTLKDVHQAATQISAGKFYEASQTLRQVQDSTRFDMVDVAGVPQASAKAPASQPPATH